MVMLSGVGRCSQLLSSGCWQVTSCLEQTSWVVNAATFYKIQDTYCVDTILEFWHNKKSEIIQRLQGKDVVALGE